MMTWLTSRFISRLEALELSVRSVRTGYRLGGRFAINRRGASMEFADYVPYAPGDDIRAIDWNLYARLDRLFVKTYKEEIALAVEVLVDATPSMGLPTREKFERAVQIAVSIGYVALAGGHHVRFHWVRAGRVTAGPWFHQRGDLMRMAQQAAAMRLGGAISLDGWVQRAVLACRMRGGQALLITDGMARPAEFFRALHILRMRHLEAKVIQVLTAQELQPARLFQGGVLVDAESGATQQLAYSPAELAQAMTDHQERLARFCKRRGIPFVLHRLDESLDAFMTQTLPAHGILE